MFSTPVSLLYGVEGDHDLRATSLPSVPFSRSEREPVHGQPSNVHGVHVVHLAR